MKRKLEAADLKAGLEIEVKKTSRGRGFEPGKVYVVTEVFREFQGSGWGRGCRLADKETGDPLRGTYHLSNLREHFHKAILPHE